MLNHYFIFLKFLKMNVNHALSGDPSSAKFDNTKLVENSLGQV